MADEKNKFEQIEEGRLSTERQIFLSDYKDELDHQYERMETEKLLEGGNLDEYISNMNYFQNEYIVDGALLTCSKCTKDIKRIKDLKTGKVIQSELKQAEERSRIHTIGERRN